jgi:hypothetical protein
MLRLEIYELGNHEYQISIKGSQGNANVWATECSEINLEEIVQKVLRVSENLRKVPSISSSNPLRK